MYRKVEKKILAWKESKNKKALLITGARQIGKTYSIRDFGKNNYDNFVEINFITTPSASAIFEGDLDSQTILMNLSAFLRRKLEPGKTLIFFDEVQECPNARTAIKFLVDDGRFDYIESGSLLGVSYKNIPSYPVGYEESIRMYPMDFEEFCLANGLDSEIIVYLEDCYKNGNPVSDSVHHKMLELFRYYVIVGGMPNVVSNFVQTHDIGSVIEKQKDLLNLYRLDISKYTKNEKVKVTSIFDRIPAQLDDKNRRFNLSDISKNARLREYEDAFVWLKDAGVALPCNSVTQLQIPLQINEQTRLFKLFMCDTGLLCAMCLENVQFEILQGNLEVNMGGILENVFAQQLAVNGFSLRYFNKQKIGELDFVIQKGAEVVPVEIKSGKDYKLHAAINNALNVKEWDLKKGIVFCKGNYEKKDRITYLPWYMIMFLNNRENKEMKFKVDIDLTDLKIDKE